MLFKNGVNKNWFSFVAFIVILIPQRIIVSIMSFLAISITFMTRTALSFSITLMVYRQQASEAECMIENNTTDISLPEDTIVIWIICFFF